MLAQIGNGIVSVIDNKFYDLNTGKELSLEEIKGEKVEAPVEEIEEVKEVPKLKKKGKFKK
jgi:hypothetical protein